MVLRGELENIQTKQRFTQQNQRIVMAGELATAVADKTQDAFTYPITIEDAGPATKKVSIEIPQERIASKLAEQFKELRREAVIPGFRVGRAPAKLVERKFASDVKEQVRRSLIAESYEQAVEKNNLQVLGEPDFDAPEQIEKLPETGPLTYSFQVEVQPEFLLPPLANLVVKKPKVEIKPEHIDQAMTNLREQQGQLVPVEDRGVEDKDYLTADVVSKVDGTEIAQQTDAQLVSRAGRVGGIQIDDLADKLRGAMSNDKREFTVKIPDTFAKEELRGKDATVEITVKDIKKLEPAVVDEAFLEDLGFKNEEELREALQQQMIERINYDVQQSMRDQVNNYLLENIKFDLPNKLSDRQAERTVQRRGVDLMMRGISEEQVSANLELLRNGAKEEGVRELKLFFILQKIATSENIDVDEAELNGRIAMLAAQRGKRPEKLKQEMSGDGTLSNLYVQMREQKSLDKILSMAKIEEVEVVKKPEGEASAEASIEAPAVASVEAAAEASVETPAKG